MSLSDQVVTEEKCEEEYVVELKEECEYSTVQDKVCSQGYSPSYSDQVCTLYSARDQIPRPSKNGILEQISIFALESISSVIKLSISA